MRWIWIIPLVLPMISVAQPGPYWAYGYGSIGDDRFTAIAKGPDASVYACGTFSGSMASPAGTVNSQGITDVFVVKMDTLGLVEWIRTGGGPGPDRCTDLAVDAAGNVAIIGQFSAFMTIEGTPLSSNGPSLDVFIARFNADGELLWARTAGSVQNTDIGEQVSVTDLGEVYVAGQFSGTALFGAIQVQSTFDPQLQTSGDDVFVAKYSASGNVLWVRTGQAPNADKALGLAVNNAGDCWLAGQYSQDITFDLPHTNSLNNAGFLVKFDSSGAEQWFRRFGGGGSILVGDLCFAGNTLWMTGSQSGNNLVFGSTVVPIASAYPYSAFVLAFSQEGDLLKQRSLGSEQVIEGKAMDVRAGEVLVAGTFFCQASELSMLNGGHGLFLSWGEGNGWVCVLDEASLEPGYAQMLADHTSMDLRGAVFGEGNLLYAVGEYDGELIIPTQEGKLRALPGDSLFAISSGGNPEVCGDTTYYDGAKIRTRGVLDGFIMKGFPRGRKPLDIFRRDNCEFSFAAEFSIQTAVPPTCEVAGYEASFCGTGQLLASFNFTNGPVPIVEWTNGTVNGGLLVEEAGTYIASGEVGPGCFSGMDSISVGLCSSPGLGGISDSFGINVEATLPEPIVTCLPDHVSLSAGPIPGVSFSWVLDPDTAIYDQTFDVPFGGLWSLVVMNEEGCTSSTNISVQYIPNTPLGDLSAEQRIRFPQDTDGNDSITICSFNTIALLFEAEVYSDGSQIGAGSTYNFLDTVYSTPSGIADIGSFDIVSGIDAGTVAYTGDGWYVFDFHLSVDDRPCYDSEIVFTHRDSLYVTGLTSTAGEVDILGPIFICSGQNVSLSAQANVPGTFLWTAVNGGILGPDNTASIVLSSPGYITVLFQPLDTGTCVSNDLDDHSVQFVPPPIIAMDPANGLVCPGSNVQLSVSGASGSYTWYGPAGILPFNTASISVQDAGTYFCVVSTAEGCEFATALRTVVLYGTPYGDVFPQPVLCEGGSVLVQVQPAENAQYTWDAPLSGNSSSQIITAPGTYSCSVTHCAQTTTLTFTIPLSTVSASIVDEGPFTICPSDSVLLQAAPGLVAYVWQPGGLIGQNVYANVEANYQLIGFDQYGCTDTARSANVIVYDFAQPLQAGIDTVCGGDVSVGVATGTGTFAWYADAQAQQLIGSGPSVSLGPFSASTTVYVTQTDLQCVSAIVSVQAVVIPNGQPLVVTGDTVVCIGTPLLLTASPGTDFEWATPLGPFIGATVNLASVGANASGTWSVSALQSGCITGSGSIDVLVDIPEVSIVDEGPFTLCAGESALLQASAGMVTYVWTPGALQGQFVSTSSAGSYMVIGTDAFGCNDTAGTAIVSTFEFTSPLTALAPVVCAGSDVDATANGSGTINWYSDASLSQILATGGSFTIPEVLDNTIVYLTQFEEPCTSAPLALAINVDPVPPAPVIVGDTLLCTGEALLLVVPSLFPAQWTTPAGIINFGFVNILFASPQQNGEYTVYYAQAGCAGDTSRVEVLVSDPPIAYSGPDQLICVGSSAELTAPEGQSWLWTTGSGQRSINVGEGGTYWVQVANEAGCVGSDTVIVTQGECEVSIPNFISPNADGVHDVITLTSPSDEPLSLEIMNRWGQLVFTRSARVVQWDGYTGFGAELVPEGVYYYVVHAILPGGVPYDRTGYLHVFR